MSSGHMQYALHWLFADIHIKFSNKVIFYQILLRLFPVCFPDFIRQIARYPPHKIRKTSSKTIHKINLSKILTGSKYVCKINRYLTTETHSVFKEYASFG